MAASVLIVEDEALIAFHLQCLVEEAGHRVTAIARDPTEAMNAAALACPDFAMVDIRLAAGTSGIEAARLLYETWGVRCLFTSANLDAQTRQSVGEFKPLGFLGKPFLGNEVIDLVKCAAREARHADAANGG
jgi:two-component system, response regulator PdtaR